MIVVDSSAINAILFGEEDAHAVLEALRRGARFLAPGLLVHEVANAIVVGIRRRRFDAGRREEAMVQFWRYPWAFETAVGPALLGEIVALAESSGLTGYDAAYLHLAHRHRCPLVTLDRRQAEVARARGIEVWPAPVD